MSAVNQRIWFSEYAVCHREAFNSRCIGCFFDFDDQPDEPDTSGYKDSTSSADKRQDQSGSIDS